MAWDLADYQTGLNLAKAMENVGGAKMAALMPSYPEWGVTIVEGWPATGLDEGEFQLGIGERGLVPGGGQPSESGDKLLAASVLPPLPPELLAQASIPEGIARVLEMGSVVRASTSWVVGGEKSHSGKPLFLR